MKRRIVNRDVVALRLLQVASLFGLLLVVDLAARGLYRLLMP